MTPKSTTNQYDLAQTAIQLISQRSSDLDKIYEAVTEINVWCRDISSKQAIVQQAIREQNELISKSFDRIHTQQDKIIMSGKIISEELSKLHKLFHDIATIP